MPALYLLRHGDADAGTPDQGDLGRILNARGNNEAALIGRYLAEKSAHPVRHLDLVLCSAAQRMQQTWALVAGYLTNPPKAQVEQDLYLCTASGLVKRVRSLPDDAENVLIIGHNPGLHEAAIYYADVSDGPIMRRLYSEFPSATLVAFQFSQAWSGISQHTGRLKLFVTPKDLTP